MTKMTGLRGLFIISYFETSILNRTPKHLCKTRYLSTCEVSIKERETRDRVSNLCVALAESPGGVTSCKYIGVCRNKNRIEGPVDLSVLPAGNDCCKLLLLLFIPLKNKTKGETPNRKARWCFPKLSCTPQVGMHVLGSMEVEGATQKA